MVEDLGAASSILEEPVGPTLSLSSLAPDAALRRLELAIIHRLEGFLHGEHLGLLPGPGSDIDEARLYVPGQDDVRRMDWSVTARTTVPHVRDTIADRELEVWALLDVTPSMNWGTGGVTKRDLGIAALATIGFLSQKMGDRFGGILMRQDKLKHLQARSGRNALYGVLRQMLTEPIVTDNSPGSMSIAQGINQMIKIQRRRGMKVVVSDFLSAEDQELNPDIPPDWESPLRILCARNQVLCVEVVDAAELALPDLGEVLIRDPETNFSRYINTSDNNARARMDAAATAQRERIKIAMNRAGAGHIQLRTDRDWVQDIARFVLTYRKVARRMSTVSKRVGK